MKFVWMFAFLLMFSIGLVVAAQNGSETQNGSDAENQMLGGYDEHGCIPSAGYTWNATEEKCVREWETGEERYQDQNQNAGDTQNMEQNRVKVQDGEHINQDGQMFQIQTKAEDKYMLKANGIEADCDCNMTQEKVENKTKLKVQLSNGVNAEVKLMPDVASERALERLRLKVCSSENNCTLELKEVGKEDAPKLAYEVQIERHSRILGIFQAKMQVKTQVDAQDGEVIKVDKPWWAFLASEPAEE